LYEIGIIGASGHGKVVSDLAETCGYEVVFYDDAYPNKKYLEHWPIKGTFQALINVKNECRIAIVAIGDNAIRSKLCNLLDKYGFNVPVLIHPTAVISKYAVINNGTVIFANVVINAFAQIGKGCIINTGAIIEHDCYLGDAVHLSPNVALGGGSKIDDTS